MTDPKHAISRKELYSGSMVIFIGIFYLIMLASSYIDSKSIVTFHWREIKRGLLSIFFIISGVLFLLRKQSGWIMTAGILLNFVLVICVIIISLAASSPLSNVALQVMLFILFLLAFVFLFRKETRMKYHVNNKSYLLSIAIYLGVITVYFLV